MFRTSRDILEALKKNRTGKEEDATSIIDDQTASKEYIYNQLKNLIIDKAFSFPENLNFVNRINALAEEVKQEILQEEESTISMLTNDLENLEKEIEQTENAKEKITFINWRVF